MKSDCTTFAHMTLLNLLTPTEIADIMEEISELTPSDFEREFGEVSYREMSDYAYVLNLNTPRFIVAMEQRAKKQGGELI